MILNFLLLEHDIMKLLKATILVLVSLISITSSANQRFTNEQVVADLVELHTSLEATHYNAFTYISKHEFDAKFQKIKSTIDKDSYSLLETINLYQRLVAVIKNGHTEIDFPIASYLQYAQAAGTIFPLEIAFEYDKPLVRKNFSEDTNIEIGAEVISINGVSISDIMSRIYPQISAERRYFKNAKLELYSFPRYYWQVYGQQSYFKVKLSSNGATQTHSFKAVDVIEGYETKRREVLNAHMKLKFYDHSAYLNPGDFSGNEKKYKEFIDASFKKINLKKVQTLIIDLRNNKGGNDSFSDYLVAYLADKPFRWNAKFSVKTSKLLKDDIRANRDISDPYWKAILNHKDGSTFEYDLGNYPPQLLAKRFKGEVYILVNRQSHSQSAVTAAQIQDYGWGIIVGEETGDYPSLYASQFHYSLPNTGITVKISKGYMVRVNGSEKEEGVIPDILIKDHLVDEKDEILEGILERLEKINDSEGSNNDT